MTDLLWSYCMAVGTVLAQSAPYMLLGFGIAALLKLFLSEERILSYLGGNDLWSVFFASLFGVPLPLCSCSVLPVAMSLKKSGASKGAMASFLISTPETGVDSIALTYALIDPIMTVARPVAAFATALFTGFVVNLFVRRGWDGPPASESASLPQHEHEHEHEHQHEHQHGHEHAPEPPGAPSLSWRERLAEGLQFAFGPLLDDLTPWFLLGLLVSGLISLLVPDDFFGVWVPNGWASSLMMVVIGVPLYICASAATPIAAALMAKGLDPGAALVFLLCGPATNATTILVVGRFLGRRLLAVYLCGIVLVALMSGSMLNSIYAANSVARPGGLAAAGASQLVVSGLEAGAAVVLLVLLQRSAVRLNLAGQWRSRIRAWLLPVGWDPFSRASKLVALAVVLCAYLGTAVSVIQAGQAGWILRFGGVVQTLDRPGIYLHWPAPIERVALVRPKEVQILELGFLRDSSPSNPAEDRDLASEAEVMTGDQNLLSVTLAVHYAIRDPFHFQYRLQDPPALVRALAEASLREALASRATSEGTAALRSELEGDILRILRRDLEQAGSGVDALAIHLLYVHAPPEAHFAFRDVASALEDKETKKRVAEGYEFQVLSQARGESARLLEEAQAYRAEKLQGALGQASAFALRLAAYRSQASLTKLRLSFDALEAALRKTRPIFLLSPDVRVEIWSGRPPVGQRQAAPLAAASSQQLAGNLNPAAGMPLPEELMPPASDDE